ncbi:MAG: GC-type dockerin domain-anchored protein, partial [Planctomycetota bacterium]
TDEFDGPGFDSNLVDVDGTYQFAGGETFNGGGRSYVRTVEQFGAINFQADLIYSIDGGGGAAGVFFGIGTGLRDSAFFGEPEASLYIVDHPDGFGGFTPTSGIGIRANLPGPGNTVGFAALPAPDGVTYARITKVGDQIAFQYDIDYDGVAFAADESLSVSIAADASFLLGGDSFLFFGSEDNRTRFDSLSVGPTPTATDIEVPVDPSSTYLRTCSDPDAEGAAVIDVGDLLVLSGGRQLELELSGDFGFTKSDTSEPGMSAIAMFSMTDELLADRSLLNRVPGAVDAGVDFTSAPTNRQNCGYPIETDVPEDFVLTAGNAVQVQVPAGARYVFISANDEFFGDNIDADGNYGVRIGVPSDCPADVNGDGLATPADFNAWILAFNSNAPGCDQNGDGLCNPSDFNAWVLNFNAGCG